MGAAPGSADIPVGGFWGLSSPQFQTASSCPRQGTGAGRQCGQKMLAPAAGKRLDDGKNKPVMPLLKLDLDFTEVKAANWAGDANTFG